MPTTITKTIGVGKDYASIDAWVAGAASTYPSGLVAADVIWRGVLYKEGTGTNNEWVITASTTGYTLTCDATRYYLLEAASGQSFTDNAGKLTNALRYNNANGVSISIPTNYVWLFNIGTSSKVTVQGIQIKLGPKRLNTGNGGLSVNKCIIESGATTEETALFSSYLTNSLIYVRNATSRISTNVQLINATIVNCTFVGSGAAHAFVLNNYSTTGNIFRNCAVFGFATGVVDNVTKINTTNSTYNATDLASFGWTATGNIVSKTFANQFQSITGGSEDFRVKAGADLINAGTRDQTYTNDLDIVGSARLLTTPTIGAWEFPSVTYSYARPASDITTQWTPSTGTGTDHYALIDETVASDTDYIVATAAGQTDEVKLASMTAPQAGTDLIINYKVAGIVGSASVTMSLRQGSAGTLIATDTAKTIDNTYQLVVPAATWSSTVTDWTDLRLRFVSA
jgi:hypothetical protein